MIPALSDLPWDLVHEQNSEDSTISVGLVLRLLVFRRPPGRSCGQAPILSLAPPDVVDLAKREDEQFVTGAQVDEPRRQPEWLGVKQF